ncbi:MAG: hypothetical protein OXN15_08565 [Chloroflexota bacterium]|nr:hypothetical protein [Chloroflexota bacterium]MDE2969591.1 hypothetical protein [Chloroflexota bacterium]
MPDEVKRIVCLANSRKLGGRCIAGKEVLPNRTIGAWVRPVTDQGSGEVPTWECIYPDGREPAVLDIMEIPVLGHVPKEYQQENWALDPKHPWEKVRVAPFERAVALLDPPAPLWSTGHSTYNGRNDRIPLQDAVGLPDSLRLISVSDLTLHVSMPGESFGETRKRVQGRFRYLGVEYWLRVTDIMWENEYLSRSNGDYYVGNAYLTISLGEPFEEFVYKLIAAIITPGGPPWKAQLRFPS